MDPIKLSIRIALAAGYVLLAAAIAAPLIAELRFDKADKMAAGYRWQDAESGFRKAIKTDPLNSKYLIGCGKFLLLQARYLDRRERALRSAEGYFRKAIEVDPRNAEPYLEAGLIALRLGSIDEALPDLKMAEKNDPNGFNTAYSTGMACMARWKEIGDKDRAFVTGRLKSAIRARPEYADEIYGEAWKRTKDAIILRAITPDGLRGQKGLYDFIVSHGLWQLRKAQAAQVEGYMKRERPKAFAAAASAKSDRLKAIRDDYAGVFQSARNDANRVSVTDWRGSTPDGRNKYMGGEMYWSGTVYALADVPRGDAVVKIRARGSYAGGAHPYMVVELDGNEIGEGFADTPEWKDYDFTIDTEGGLKVLSVTFANDWCDTQNGEDRNLFVARAEVIKHE